MQLRVYDGEHYSRSRLWYLIAGVVFFVIVISTLFGGQFTGAASSRVPSWWSIFATLLLMIFGGLYRFKICKQADRIVVATLDSEWVEIDGRRFDRSVLEGFTLEVQRDTWQVHNIILLQQSDHHIFTVADTSRRVREFVLALSKQILVYPDFQQSWIDRQLRKLKI